jgi:uncharacterized protein YbaR (Trm112 family)
MSVDPRLLEILCCPATKIPVRMLSGEKLRRLNTAVSAGSVKTLDGNLVAELLAEGLVTENGTTIYRVDDGIPIMLEELGIPTHQLEGFRS